MACGPNKYSRFVKPPNLIFKKSCQIHDKDYFNKNGKIKSDFNFLKNMLQDIKNSNQNILVKIILRLIAYFYFCLVFLFGFLFY